MHSTSIFRFGLASLVLTVACGGEAPSTPIGGNGGSGGLPGAGSGGAPSSGGATTPGAGGASSGGAVTSNGGATNLGGNAGATNTSGGASSGGVANGGTSNGGTSNGGTSNGGTSNGGTSNGGTSNGGTSSGGVTNGGMSGGSVATGGKGGTTSTGGAVGKGGSVATGGTPATGGATATGGSSTCQTPSPPAELQNTIDLTWKEMTGGFEGKTGARPKSASIMTFKNSILDQVMENGGSLNYCVRWESTVTATTAWRDKVQPALQRSVDEWFAKLNGHNCFPYSKINVKVVGWAVRDRATLGWSDDTIPVYVNDIRENAPQCAEACGRFFHQQAGYTYSTCSGGKANHYDMSLWLTEGMGNGGAGGDWGQRIDRAYFTGGIDSAHLHIHLHEFGHGFGFPDYYNWDEWVPGTAVPNSVMVAGLATMVTEWDGWMLRHTWNNLKSRWP